MACRSTEPQLSMKTISNDGFSPRAQVVIKLAEADVSVGALSALRFGIAALCFLPAAVRGLRIAELRGTALELGVWLFGEAPLSSPDCRVLMCRWQSKVQVGTCWKWAMEGFECPADSERV